MVTVVVLAVARGRYDRYGDDLERRRADDPMPGGVGR
jgi:NADH-quinone oxidoreductase subunit J